MSLGAELPARRFGLTTFFIVKHHGVKTSKIQFFIIARLVLFANILVNVPVSVYSQTVQAQLLLQIRERDSSALLLPSDSLRKPNGGFSVSFVAVSQPIPGYTYGVTVSSGEAAWSGDWCVLKILSGLEHDPVYRPPEAGHKRDPAYDSSGNLAVPHTAEQYFICTKGRNDSLDVVRKYTVDSQGTVTTNKTPWLQLYQSPPGDRSSLYLFRQLLQATGRGFSEDLVAVASEKPSDGEVQAEVRGRFGSALTGRWIFELEKGPDPLVRAATFFADVSPEQPYVEVSNSGVVECRGLKLAQTGDLRIGPLKRRFEIVGLTRLESSDPDQCALYREVFSRLKEPLPAGSQILDRRGQQPKITDVEK